MAFADIEDKAKIMDQEDRHPPPLASLNSHRPLLVLHTQPPTKLTKYDSGTKLMYTGQPPGPWQGSGPAGPVINIDQVQVGDQM